eukprot:6803370-Prymnesium_polylepis.1
MPHTHPECKAIAYSTDTQSGFFADLAAAHAKGGGGQLSRLRLSGEDLLSLTSVSSRHLSHDPSWTAHPATVVDPVVLQKLGGLFPLAELAVHRILIETGVGPSTRFDISFTAMTQLRILRIDTILATRSGSTHDAQVNAAATTFRRVLQGLLQACPALKELRLACTTQLHPHSAPIALPEPDGMLSQLPSSLVQIELVDLLLDAESSLDEGDLISLRALHLT